MRSNEEEGNEVDDDDNDNGNDEVEATDEKDEEDGKEEVVREQTKIRHLVATSLHTKSTLTQRGYCGL